MEQRLPDSSLTRLRVIIGQTASGKNAVASLIASRNNYEIISVDSMKIYRGMDIGTSKAPAEQRKKVRYHLIDIADPDESYNAARFVADCERAIADISGRGLSPLLVCGTPLYLKVLLYGIFSGSGSDANIRSELEKLADDKGLDSLYQRLIKVDPAKADKIHANDRKRIIRALEVHQLTGRSISSLQTHFSRGVLRYPVTMAGLQWKPEELYQRINTRVERMFDSGLVDEVKWLVNSERGLSRQSQEAIGYKEVIMHLNGKITLDEAKEAVKKGTRYLARKQMTWFRKFPDIKWIECLPGSDTGHIIRAVAEALS